MFDPGSFVQAADFNPSTLISDGEFVAIDGLSVDEIQRFLANRGSFLRDFSEGGRSAAQIIWDAAHGKNEASGTINGIAITEATGTVHPGVILATLQKEQSLISRTERNDDALRAAMGYACPDSGGCNSAYAGFTKQVENGAWQLRYNFERSSGHGFSDYQVGQSFCFSDLGGSQTNCGTYDNRATAALYRYTPHVRNGNFNFWNFFSNVYAFTSPEYAALLVAQSWSGGSTVYPTVRAGQTTTLTVQLRNAGRLTWQRGTVNLGTNDPEDRTLPFDRSGSAWQSANRIALAETSVAPGEVGTFTFSLNPPVTTSPRTTVEHFRAVADGANGWFGPDVSWAVTVRSGYEPTVTSWSTTDGPYTYPTLAQGGVGKQLTLQVTNAGSETWTRGVVNLATALPRDRESVFLRESRTSSPSGWVSKNRVSLQEASVAPGGTGTFTFWLAAPTTLAPGTYRENFELVADGVTWLPERGIYWDVTVVPAYTGTVATWSSSDGSYTYPRLSRGGAGKELSLRVRNDGSVTWTRGVVNLATALPRDRESVFLRESRTSSPSGWVSKNRVSLQEASVAPGGTGTFTFWLAAPTTLAPGTYRENFELVADGVTWLPERGIYWDVVVE